MILKLNDKIKKDIDSGFLKAKTLVEFILNNTSGITDKVDLNQAALKDIKINNKYIKKVTIDTWTNQAIIEF